MRGVIFLMAFTVALSACAGDETKVVLSTNDVVAVAQRVQCHSVTKSGNRCKRKAVPGKLYCGRKMFLQLERYFHKTDVKFSIISSTM